MRSAFSLVEVLVAAAISVLVIVPMSAIFQQSVHQTSLSYDEVRASFLARELIEQMQLMPYVTGFDRIRPISSHKESTPWMDLSQPDIAAIFPNNTIPDKEAESRALSRLYLTPLPEGFRRLLKLYPANQSKSKTSYEGFAHLYELHVMIEWKAPHSSKFNRRLQLSSLIGRDQVMPGENE